MTKRYIDTRRRGLRYLLALLCVGDGMGDAASEGPLDSRESTTFLPSQPVKAS